MKLVYKFVITASVFLGTFSSLMADDYPFPRPWYWGWGVDSDLVWNWPWQADEESDYVDLT